MRRTEALFLLCAVAAFAAPPQWRLAKPVTYQNLAIYPVLSDQARDTSGFLTLDEGLASGQVRVVELAGAQVNRLAVVNRSGRPLLLLGGEIIEGGKQDRMISEDHIVLPGDKPAPIDVYCVEPGRWQGRQSHFGTLQAIVNPAVREQAVAYKSQQGVWARGGEAADRVLAVSAAGAPADSTSYARVYRLPAAASPVANSAATLKGEYERALREELKGKRVVGVVVEINRRPVWADVFASSELFEKYWPKLLSSYVVEAVARRGSTASAASVSAQQFLQRSDGAGVAQSGDGAYALERSEAGGTLTFLLSSRVPGREGPLHFTRFERGDPTR